MSANPLEIYARELRRWNKAINLVSPKTLDELETRHIEDSLQMTDHLPDHPVTIMDWGSGGGLPGMVIALSRPDDTVHFVESDLKKCEFLRFVSRETKIAVHVHTMRIETVKSEILRPDFITARALAPLSQLLSWMLPWSEAYPAVEALFMKGENWQEELESAAKDYIFDHDVLPSRTDKKAHIVRIKNLTKAL
jgi:16S rRNA (guanine527-N7)-methyltransferase